MSIQTLLPRDVLLRQVAICYPDDELPVVYQTGRGKVKGRNSETLRESFISDHIKWHLHNAPRFLHGDKISMSNFDCNLVSWKVIDHLLSNDLRNEDYFLDAELGKDMLPASDIVALRLGNWVPEVEKQLMRDVYDDSYLLIIGL